jgi:hypothetical protein
LSGAADLCFAGDPQTPDAVLPNNVLCCPDARTQPDGRRYVVGRAPVRQRSARADIRQFFAALGYAERPVEPGACLNRLARWLSTAHAAGFMACRNVATRPGRS